MGRHFGLHSPPGLHWAQGCGAALSGARAAGRVRARGPGLQLLAAAHTGGEGTDCACVGCSLEGKLMNLCAGCRQMAAVIGANTDHPTLRSERLGLCSVFMWREGRALAQAVPYLRGGEEPKEWARQAAGTPTAELEVLAAARRCAHLRCTNLEGASEAELSSKTCSGCRLARYCSPACAGVDWRQHKVTCRQLAAKREKQAQADARLNG